MQTWPFLLERDYRVTITAPVAELRCRRCERTWTVALDKPHHRNRWIAKLRLHAQDCLLVDTDSQVEAFECE